MAMTQQERDAKRRAKDAKTNFEDLRMKAGQGTRQALAELMEWADLEEKGEAMTLMIHRLHELGREAAIHFLTPPRHKITISPIVARKLLPARSAAHHQRWQPRRGIRMKQEKITLTVGEAKITLPAATIAQLALATVISQIAPTPSIPLAAPGQVAIPEIGKPWPGQGGINGGFVPAIGDVPAHYLIFANEDIGEHEWGGRNQESKATSRNDGKANTDILIAEGGHPAAEAARAHQADGYADFDLPATSQLYQAWVHGLITDGVYWSSSQRSAYYAFLLGFEDGIQGNYDKSSELRVRPVRRYFI